MNKPLSGLPGLTPSDKSAIAKAFGAKELDHDADFQALLTRLSQEGPTDDLLKKVYEMRRLKLSQDSDQVQRQAIENLGTAQKLAFGIATSRPARGGTAA